MAPDLFFYQLALIALVWLYLMLHWAWSSDPVACSTTAEFSSPLPKPKPFAGLLHKPHCEACEQDGNLRREPSCAPPPQLVFLRGRRRQVDTAQHFCPAPDCRYGGWTGLGNMG